MTKTMLCESQTFNVTYLLQ